METATQIEVTSAGTLLREAVHAVERGEWAKAVASAKGAARQDASWSALGPVVLGLYAAGRLEESLQVLQFTRRDPETLNALGCSAFELGRLDAGVSALRQAVAAAPSCPSFLANLSVAFRAQGRPVEAAACLRRAQQLDPLDLRIDRLALMTAHAAPAERLPTSAGQCYGHILSCLSPMSGSVRKGLTVNLKEASDPAWDLRIDISEEAPPLPPRGLLIASLWNDAGLFLKEGRLSWVSSPEGKLLARVDGPPARWIQRRRYFRILAGDFLKVELEGARVVPRRLRDLSAQGFSYYDDTPPEPGLTHAWQIGLAGVDLELPGVVRAVRPSPSGRPVVGVEFMAPEKQVDRLARAIHEHMRRLHSFRGSSKPS